MSEVSGGAPVAAPSAPAESGAPVENSISESGSQGESSSQASEQIDAIQDAFEAGELTQAEAKSMIKKFQLKVKGKTIEKEYDLGDDDFMRNQFQLAEVSKQSMQEKAELEKQFRHILETGRGNPAQFLKEAFGIDPDEFAAMHIEKKIEHLKKTPEQIEIENMRAELQAAREKEKKTNEEKETLEMSKLQQEALVGLQDEIGKAISAHTKLPNSGYVQKKMADAMLWAANNGFDDVTAEDVAPLVEKEMRDQLNSLFDEMPEDTLELYAGRKNIERLRKSKIAKAKEVPSVNAVKSTSASANRSEAPKVEVKLDSKKFWRGR